MASITTWVRLEPRARDADLLPGIEARLHDPLWLLARQWQLGELTGSDGGSAVIARARADVAPVDAVRAPGGAWQPRGAVPLEPAALAPAPDERAAAPPIARRAREGRHLLRLLEVAEVVTRGVLAAVPLAVDAAALAGLDPAERAFVTAMRGRVPDGDAAAAALAPIAEDPGAPLPPALEIPAAQAAAARGAIRTWLAWRTAAAQTTASPTWRDAALGYRFDARAAGATRDIVLSAPDHTAGSVRWFDVDAAPGEPAARAPASVVATALPTRVRFRGMPARRYWELEDAAVHWPSIDAGPGDIGRILFVEFALIFGDHWLMVPLELPAGAVARVASLVVTDTFGERVLVRTADELDGAGSPWHFLEQSRPPELPGPLVLVAPTVPSLVGPPVAAVDYARDELSNVVWAIERVRRGADGVPRQVAPTPAPVAASAAPAYRAGPAVGGELHPYRPRLTAAGPALALAAIPDRPITSRPDLPLQLRPDALPSRPIRVVTQAELVRDPDGRYHLVERREHTAAPMSAAPALTFDVVEEPR